MSLHPHLVVSPRSPTCQKSTTVRSSILNIFFFFTSFVIFNSSAISPQNFFWASPKLAPIEIVSCLRHWLYVVVGFSMRTLKKATRWCNLNPEWASLHDLALSLILDKLLEHIDHVRFSAVCKQWQSFAETYRQTRPQYNRKLLPWLLIPPPPDLKDDPQEKNRRSQVYSIPEAKIYNNIDLSFPYYSRRCCGSSYGWLATVDKAGLCITLHCPFRKAAEPIRLPPLDAVVVPVEHASLFEFYVVKVVLSDDPSLNPDNYAVVIYAVGKHGKIVWLDFNNNSQVLEELVSSGHIENLSADGAYLVESTKGDLLHVRRVRFLASGNCRQLHTYQIFEVFKLVFFNERGGEKRVEFVKQRDIGGESLFLGDNHSISVLASNYPECLQPNSIYFVDDLTFFRPMIPIDEGPCDDLGIYNYERKSSTQYVNWQLRKPPAIWILPSINYRT